MGLSTRAVAQFTLHPAVVGLLWGAGSPLLVTLDGGVAWTPHGKVADGVERVVRSANAGTGKAMTALVYDSKRSATLVMISADSTGTWHELSSFPGAPCCGG